MCGESASEHLIHKHTAHDLRSNTKKKQNSSFHAETLTHTHSSSQGVVSYSRSDLVLSFTHKDQISTNHLRPNNKHNIRPLCYLTHLLSLTLFSTSFSSCTNYRFPNLVQTTCKVKVYVEHHKENNTS